MFRSEAPQEPTPVDDQTADHLRVIFCQCLFLGLDSELDQLASRIAIDAKTIHPKVLDCVYLNFLEQIVEKVINGLEETADLSKGPIIP